MGLSNCLYCGKFISDSAQKCIFCNNWEPFNKNKYEKWLFGQKAEKEKERILNEYIKCKDCGFVIKKEQVWNSKGSFTCPTCGNAKIYIECFICGNIADYFDPYQNSFTCYLHYTEKCNECGKLITSEKKIDETYRNRRAICKSCYDKKESIAFWKEFPVSFILRPIGFGLAFFFLIGIIGSVIRIILGNNFFKSIDNAFSVEGFIGFFFGFIWAILKRKELD